MLFRAPGKSNPFQYSNGNPYQPIIENNQKSAITFNQSFTVGQKCMSQQKLGRNNDQRFFNFQAPSTVLKTEPTVTFQDSRYRPSSYYKSPTNTQLSRVAGNMQNNSTIAIEQQCLILRKQKSQLSQKVKKVEQQLQSKQNVIRGKQREIDELKIMQTQSLGMVKAYSNESVADVKKEKQKLYYQVIELQAELHKLQQKYQKMQREHYSLASKYDQLVSKSSQDQARKLKREQLLQSELSLAEKRNQRLKAEYQRQLACIKDRCKQLQQSNYSQNKSAVYAYNLNGFMQNNYSSVKSTSPSESSESMKGQMERLTNQIRQKNQMIKYLQMQCVRQNKKRQSKDLNNNNQIQLAKINNLYEESKRQLAKQLKQNDNVRRQIGMYSSKLQKAEKLCEQYKKQVKDLQYLLKQVKNKEFRANINEENRALNKMEKQLTQKYQLKIKQMDLQFKKVNGILKNQAQSVQKKYQKMLSDQKQKSQLEILSKTQQLKQFLTQKQKLSQKLSQYQTFLKAKQEQLAKLNEQKNKYKQIDDQRRSIEIKITEDLNNNVLSLQKQLKSKVEQLFMAQSTKISLEKELYTMRKVLEQKITQITMSIKQLEDEKKKYEKQQSASQTQISNLKKIINDHKASKQQNGNKQQQIEDKFNVTIKRNQQRYETTIKACKQQQRKLQNMIADYQKNNLNLAIQLENEKQNVRKVEQKITKLQQQKNKFKSQQVILKEKVASVSTTGEQIRSLKQNLQKTKASLQQKIKILAKKQNQFILKEQYAFKLESELAEYKTKYESLSQICKNNTQTSNKFLLQSKQKDFKNNQLQEQLTKLKEQVETKNQNINQFTRKMVSLQEKMKFQINKNEETKIQLAKLKQFLQIQKTKSIQCSQSQKIKINGLQVEISKIKQQIVVKNNKIKQLQMQIAKLKDQQRKVSQINIKTKVQAQAQKQLQKKDIEQFKQQINILQTQLKQKQSEIITKNEQIKLLQSQLAHQKNVQTQLKQKQSEIITKNEQIKLLQNQLADKQILQTQIQDYQNKIAALQTDNMAQSEELILLKKVIEEQQTTQYEQRQSLADKQKYNKQIQNQLEELSSELAEIKTKFEQSEVKKSKVTERQQEQKSLKMSKISNLSSQSFIADYIEIDKNALLYICDLLGIEPSQGQILKSIIQFIENNEPLRIQQHYKQILELFGVETQLTQKTQEQLIGEIKNFRTTITSLVQKVTILEGRNQSLSKEKHRLNKQLGRIQANKYRMILVENILDELNQQIMKNKILQYHKKLSQKKQEQQNQ